MGARLRSILGVVLVCLFALAPAIALGATDPYLQRQWGMRKVGAEQAWKTGQGAGVTIAVVDTGVDTKHEDLKANIVGGHDFISDDADARDEHGHGTHVAGIAAAAANNGVGVAGVAPRAKIMPVRVLGADGHGTGADIERGVRWAVEHGADVVNLSLSSGVVIENLSGGALSDIVEYAWSKGVVSVISAGNESFFRTDLRGAPALIVTATDPKDAKPDYATSVGFAQWGLAAPGGTAVGGNANLIYSTLWSKEEGSTYGYGQGTSMSAPHVAGAAAILLGLGLTPQATVDRIVDTADDIGAEGRDFRFGHGRLNAAAAVKGLQPATSQASAPPAPKRAATSTTQPAPDSGPSTTTPPLSMERPLPDLSDPTSETDGAPAPKQSTVPSPRGLAIDEEVDPSRVPGLLVVGGAIASAGALAGVAAWRKFRPRF